MKDFRPSDNLPAPPQLVGQAALIMTLRQLDEEKRLQQRLRRAEAVMEVEENRMPALRTFQMEQLQLREFRKWLRGYGERAVQATRAGYLEAARMQRAEDKEEEELWGSDAGDGEEEKGEE